MKKISILLLMMFFVVGCFGGDSNKYELVYHFKNPSLGPVNGSKKYKIIVENKEIISAADIKSGQSIAVKKIPGIKLYKQALHGNSEKATVEFNKEGLPVKVSNKPPKGTLGGGYTVEIIKIIRK